MNHWQKYLAAADAQRAAARHNAAMRRSPLATEQQRLSAQARATEAAERSAQALHDFLHAPKARRAGNAPGRRPDCLAGLTPQQMDQIEQDYIQKVPIGQIAWHYGLSLASVWALLHARGTIHRPQVNPKGHCTAYHKYEDSPAQYIERVAELHIEGLDNGQIKHRLKISDRILKLCLHWARERGLIERPRYKATYQRVTELRQQGLDLDEIAEQLGTTRERVRVAETYGIKRAQRLAIQGQ